MAFTPSASASRPRPRPKVRSPQTVQLLSPLTRWSQSLPAVPNRSRSFKASSSSSVLIRFRPSPTADLGLLRSRSGINLRRRWKRTRPGSLSASRCAWRPTCGSTRRSRFARRGSATRRHWLSRWTCGTGSERGLSVSGCLWRSMTSVADAPVSQASSRTGRRPTRRIPSGEELAKLFGIA